MLPERADLALVGTAGGRLTGTPGAPRTEV
jgi:hypothetical protein